MVAPTVVRLVGLDPIPAVLTSMRIGLRFLESSAWASRASGRGRNGRRSRRERRGGAEKRDELLQTFGVVIHFLSGAGELLRGGGVSLGYLIDLNHRAIDLGDAGSLFFRRGRHFLNQLGGFVDRGDQLAEHTAGLFGDCNA